MKACEFKEGLRDEEAVEKVLGENQIKINEAIEQLKDLRINQESFLDGKDADPENPFRKDIEAIDIALKALEKQIPKKVGRKPWTISKCPCCGKELGEWLEDGYHKDYEDLTICECGQKLDWDNIGGTENDP